MKTEKEKMLAGEYYRALDPQLSAERQRCRLLLKQFNDSRDDEVELRKRILHELFGGQSEEPWIEPPFYCDYGTNIILGNGVFLNFNCVVLDVAQVKIGDGTLFGPNVQVYTATHPMGWQERSSGLEFGKPITIGTHVWVGGGAIFSPGVTVGDRTVIGAGSVITKDIPSDVFAAGNPCKVIRQLND